MTAIGLFGDYFGVYCAAPVADARADEGDGDRRAMERLARGDVDALGELYDRHHAAVRRLAARMSAGAEDGDDIVHATFLNAMKSAGTFEPHRSVRAWLLGIAARLMQRQRTQGARWARLLRASFRPAEPAWTSDPERALAAREGLTQVERALAGLAEPKRLVLIMAEVEGLSGEEIAEALEIPVGTVWTRLHHARRELSAALHEGPE
ncbi:MAG TPA: RNA polymerase sigma factor [Polyangiaceae bacterium]|jgi:RNA polymerase sigma-70 factor (ECF subfamily)|nr:RNA polymerase sigma factor [Polyangiaceae bacterium]